MAEKALDWEHVVGPQAKAGLLMAFLDGLPRERWSERDWAGSSLLHYACEGPNEDAVRALLEYGLDVNERGSAGGQWAPAHCAAANGNVGVLLTLICNGADLRLGNFRGDTALALALLHPERHGTGDCAIWLMASGARLRDLPSTCRDYILPHYSAFERGLLRCRQVVVALLHVKRVGGLARWDKFLLKEIALCVWATRVFSTMAWQQDEGLCK